MEEVILKSNWIIRFPIELDGGGVNQRDAFVKKIAEQGRTYHHGLEWCAGMGLIGYDILAHEYCENMSFNDKFDLAVKNIMANSISNGLRNKVKAYHGDSISVIPEDKMFDLVVANPPHGNSRMHWEQLVANDHKDSSDQWSLEKTNNWARLIIDEDWVAHYDFFKHIKKYLVADADIFICENGKYSELENLFKIDFNIITIDPFPSLGNAGLLYHLKAKA